VTARRAFLRRLAGSLSVGASLCLGLAGLARATDTQKPSAAASLGLAEVAVGRDPAGVWILRGNVNVSLSLVLVAAIERGVTLQFESIFRAERGRWYWFPERVYEQRRVGRLTFHPITRLFRVRLDGSPPRTFADLTEALRHCLVVRGWQVAGADQDLVGLDLSLRLRLDKAALPKSLQITAFASDDWNLTTGWVPVVYDPAFVPSASTPETV
jgi:hypothetical protein